MWYSRAVPHGVLGVFVSLLIASCASSTTLYDSQTHFLSQCAAESPCQEGLECICGLCTRTCGAPGQCAAFEGAICAEASVLGSEASCSARDLSVFACVPGPDSSIEGVESASAEELLWQTPTATLVSWFDGDPIVGESYEVRLLEAPPTGTPTTRGSALQSDPETGELQLPMASERGTTVFHVLGSSYAVEDGFETIVFDTYDSVLLNFSWQHGDRRIRVPLVEMAGFEQAIAQVVPELDRAALTGHVYGGPANEVRGSVACAELFLDDASTGMDQDAAQRYLASNRLPAAPQDQTHTSSSGGFYFGNLSPGTHRMRVTLDGGQTFVADEKVAITMVRADAWGPAELMLYQFDMHVDATSDPTPSDCTLEAGSRPAVRSL